MRWFANIYGWHWRSLFPISAGFELIAVILFVAAASRHKLPESMDGKPAKTPMELWMVSVLLGTAGLAAAVIFNFVECLEPRNSRGTALFSARARSEISRVIGLGISRASGVGFLRTLVTFVPRNFKARRTIVSSRSGSGSDGSIVRRCWMDESRQQSCSLRAQSLSGSRCISHSGLMGLQRCREFTPAFRRSFGLPMLGW